MSVFVHVCVCQCHYSTSVWNMWLHVYIEQQISQWELRPGPKQGRKSDVADLRREIMAVIDRPI